MSFEYKLIRSKRKTIAIQVKSNLELVVRAPFKLKQREIDKFVLEKESWINAHLTEMKKALESVPSPFTDEELNLAVIKAKQIIPEKTAYWANVMNVNYNKITIRKQTTRWGSCSSKGNLNFNALLSFCPDDVVNYIVIHELAHRLEMNHSKRFWHIVLSFCPNYKEYYSWLKKDGKELIKKLRK